MTPDGSRKAQDKGNGVMHGMGTRRRGRLAILVVAGLLAGIGMGGEAGSALAQDYDWINDVPPALKGAWVLRDQRCDDPDSQLIIFSDGGYRWRKSRTDWGFARGKYSAYSPHSSQIFFRVQRFIQQERPDFQINVSGTELRKYSYGSGQQLHYEKCLNGIATQ